MQEPLSLVFDLVEELQLLAEAARTPYSEVQLVSFGVEILRNTHDFQDGIKSWNRLPTTNRNWTNFITHFEQEYQELLELRGPTMQSSTLHSANAIIERVKASVKQSVETSATKALTRHGANSITQDTKQMAIPNVGNIPPVLQNLPPSFTIHEVQPVNNNPSVAFSSFSSNGSSNQTDMEKCMKLFMEKMDDRMKQQEQALKDITNCLGNNSGGGGGSSYCKCQNNSKYCWSHGACAHSSADCNNKKRGHQNDATFNNKMGGSTRFCKQ